MNVLKKRNIQIVSDILRKHHLKGGLLDFDAIGEEIVGTIQCLRIESKRKNIVKTN